jgi:hypothetical protein
MLAAISTILRTNDPLRCWLQSRLFCGYLDPAHKRDSASFLEKRMRIAVTGEVVFTESLCDPAVLEAFRIFTYSRERLFNSSMANLGFDYEFKAIFDGPDALESVADVVVNPLPPSAD